MLALALRPPGASAKIYTNEALQAYDNWVYLDKFAYDTTGKGKVTWELQVQTSEGVANGGSPRTTCSTCQILYDGTPVNAQGGCERLKTVNRTTFQQKDMNSDEILTYCFVYDMREPGDRIPCTDWDSKHSISWGDCTTTNSQDIKLLFYNDVDKQFAYWEDVYRSDATCDEKLARAAASVPIEATVITAGELPVLEAAVPHFWYVVISNCQANALTQTEGGAAYSHTIVASVRLQFFNQGWDAAEPSSYHFSFDEQGFWEIAVTLVSIYCGAAVLLLAMVRTFMEKDLLHEIHWLLIGSFMCYLIAACLQLAHFQKYAFDGVGSESADIFARCFEVVGYLIFVNVLLLIARGWTITTSKLSRKTEALFFTAILVAIYVGIFFSETLRDRADSFYVYDTWAGYLLIAMNLILLVTFLMLLHRTYVFEKRVVKRNFYRRFGFIYTMWFLQMPVLVLISRTIPVYYRAKTLYATERFIQLLAFLLIPMLQRPKNSYEVYSTSDNYDARIPSINRQLRVQPMAIELPRTQVGGGLPGSLPPINREMTTNLAEANRRMAASYEASRVSGQRSEGGDGAAGTGCAADSSSARARSQLGEGIIES